MAASAFSRLKMNPINWIVFCACFTLIGVGIYFIFNVEREHRASHKTMERYIAWENAAREMHSASEYLTQEARNYAKTLNSLHALNYLNELYDNKRRERSLRIVYANKNNLPEGAEALIEALEHSDSLAKKELYAIRLLAEATNETKKELFTLTQDVRLTSTDKSLASEEKISRASELLFDSAYDRDQRQIMDAIQHFIEAGGCSIRSKEIEHMDAIEWQIHALGPILATLLICLIFLLIRMLKLSRRCNY